MKQTRVTIAIVLLFALLLSGCGLAAPRRTEAAGAPAAVSAPWEMPGGYVVQPLAAPVGQAAPAPAMQPAPAEAVRPAPNSVGNTTMFNAKFEGDAVAGSGEVVDGVYRFVATETDGEAWHVKLECNYPTVAGRDYRVTYRFLSDVAGTVKFGDFQEFEIQKGENSVTGMLIASGGTSYLDLQLGMLPPFTIDFTEVEVEEFADRVDYENALSSPVNFEREAIVYEKHDQGYAPLITRTGDSVSLNYVAVPWETGVWKSRLYIKTGLVPEPGDRYRITADVSCDQDMPFEVLFNDGDIEKGYGALYGQTLEAGQPTTCEAVLIGSSSDGEELVLQFSLGEAPEESTVTIGNLRIEKINDHYTSELPEDFALDTEVYTGNIITTTVPVAYTGIPLDSFSYTGTDSVYERHDDDYAVSLEESGSGATMRISQAPANDRGVWKAKLYAATGVTLEAGTSYRISYDLLSAADQAEYEVCFDGDYENAYGALYGRSLTAGGTDHVEQIVTPDVSHGELTLRLQLGKTDTTAGNTFTLSGLRVEKLEPQYQSVGNVSFDLGSKGSVSEEHYDGIEQTLSTTDDTATLNVTAARTEGGVWSSKLIVNTGVVPEAGEKYRVSATVAATGDMGEFEILYQNTGADALYGEQKPLTAAGDYSFEFTAPDAGCGELALVFQVGNTAADNAITVSKLQVRKVLGESLEAVELPGFAYPVEAESNDDPGSFELEANSGAAAVLSGDGASATATVTVPGDDWHVKFYAKPGVELEAGKTYTITMDVTGADGCTVCFKNTAVEGEEGFGTATVADGKVTHTVTPTTGGTLEILLKIGNVAANTAVTVKDVQVSKVTGESGTPVTLTGFAYPVASYTTAENSFALETNNGAAAALTGNGTSATATVTTPGDDWHVKLYAKPGVTLAAGVTYTITMDVAGADGCTACFKNTAVEGEEGFGTETVSGGKVTRTVTPTTGDPAEDRKRPRRYRRHRQQSPDPEDHDGLYPGHAFRPLLPLGDSGEHGEQLL